MLSWYLTHKSTNPTIKTSLPDSLGCYPLVHSICMVLRQTSTWFYQLDRHQMYLRSTTRLVSTYRTQSLIVMRAPSLWSEHFSSETSNFPQNSKQFHGITDCYSLALPQNCSGCSGEMKMKVFRCGLAEKGELTRNALALVSNLLLIWYIQSRCPFS